MKITANLQIIQTLILFCFWVLIYKMQKFLSEHIVSAAIVSWKMLGDWFSHKEHAQH